MSDSNNLRIAYLTLQRTQQGVASYAHVVEIIHGLRKRDCEVDLYEVPSDPTWWVGRILPLRILYFFWLQARLIKRLNNYDVLYIRGHFLAFVAASFAHRKGLTVLHEINGSYKDLDAAYSATKWIHAPLKRLQRKQYIRANGLISVTKGLATWVQSEGATAPIEVIPNGANHELFRPDAPPPSGVPDRYLAFVAALAPWQGVSVLLAAIQHPDWPPDLDLVIVGDGEARAEVEQASSDSRVHYLGKRPYDEIPGIVANSLGGLSPQTDFLGRSQLGLYPLKVFETMACGVPVVVTDFPGQSELVREADCGLVIPPDDAQALAAAAAELGDPNRVEKNRLRGQAGRRAIESVHSWDCRAAATLDFIERVRNHGAD